MKRKTLDQDRYHVTYINENGLIYSQSKRLPKAILKYSERFEYGEDIVKLSIVKFIRKYKIKFGGVRRTANYYRNIKKLITHKLEELENG